MENRKYFFGWYKDRSQLTCCSWVEHSGISIGPRITFLQKHEIEEHETEDINALKRKYPFRSENNL